MEIKKCARCGKFYVSEVEVCNYCEEKDNADLSRLKSFFEVENVVQIAKNKVLASTGVSSKNLNRYINNNIFEGIEIVENINVSNEVVNQGLNNGGINNLGLNGGEENNENNDVTLV